MMSILFMYIFMIPLAFINFWLIQYFLGVSVLILAFKFSFNYIYVHLSMGLGLDLLSYVMVLLSVWVSMLMIMASSKINTSNYYPRYFLLMNMGLMIVLILTFSSLNLFIFYLFFEVSLIPVLLMILGWGYQPERLQAGMYLLFYTLFASLPMMVAIFYCYYSFNSLDFYLLSFNFLNSPLLYLCLNFVFFIKLPMFFVHLWLPKAHVEAPVAGSMILAGIMLKLGGYGLMRVIMIFSMINIFMNFYFITISLVGGLIISLICLRQSDLKSLIAYSSVAHMGLVLGGIMTLNYWGLCGSLMMMVAHGLCSSGLFCLANIVYERVGSRSIYLNKGMLSVMPSLSFWWFLLCSSNMAAPPSLNLAGEVMLINSLVSWNFFTMTFLVFLSFFSAVYSLYLFSFTQHGKIAFSFSYSGGCMREYLLLFMHWFPLNLLILKGEYFSLWL
uniref:NADH dehydrogenase subunit 4 n=1 Tax=Tenebroides mauritanicus TaxID=433272 RepID=UPI002000E680|nr:NADH dehydrogenase subunit 4 [Tenebroides mauritanicus]UNZ12738.1 NADH dehydrogenase subunit 4 [Tenebroides mauritanicus]